MVPFKTVLTVNDQLSTMMIEWHGQCLVKSVSFSIMINKKHIPAMSNSAASMTAAPLSMVAIRMSWPGQSTKLTWRTSWKRPVHDARRQGKLSSFDEPPET